ncbi:Uncharacterised protein [Legionella hackeliae]|uniref:Uncharacterized protein n=1 Tax=Legionella hackeliae TaxID=449 RepID=A0A0A8UMQ9_LEGHA|nr:protein of unknown function [Legionella hackeliae]STX46835.1 Uncharacterised protein [Legionella hackeliae]
MFEMDKFSISILAWMIDVMLLSLIDKLGAFMAFFDPSFRNLVRFNT